jgi:hypothetical protein
MNQGHRTESKITKNRKEKKLEVGRENSREIQGKKKHGIEDEENTNLQVAKQGL